MCKEEVTLRDKYTTWSVYRKIDGKLQETIEKTVPMTPNEALKHFKAKAIGAVID